MEKGEKVIIGLVIVVTLVFVGGAAVGGMVVMPVMMDEMHKPEKCAENCHEMEPFYISLEESAHAGEDCHHCHKPHGMEMFMYMGHATHHAEAMVEAMMEGKDIEEALMELAEEIEEKPPASPKTEHCVDCHVNHSVAMPATITDPDISCVRCHDGVGAVAISHTAHKIGEYSAYESPDYSDHMCVACHDDHDIRAKEETCNNCHPPEKLHG